MFSIGSDGRIKRDRSKFAKLIEASLPAVRDFKGLQPQAHIAALLIPDLIASSLAPATRNSDKTHFAKLYNWCQAFRRTAIPPEEETILSTSPC